MPAFLPDADPAAADGRLAEASRRARTRLQALLCVLVAAALAWTSHDPADVARYWLWSAPVLLGGALVFATRERLPLSSLVSAVLALTGVFLMVVGTLPAGGGALPATAGLPAVVLGPAELALARAFLVGASAALVAREVLLRKSPLLPGRWLSFLAACTAPCALQALDALAFAARGLWSLPAAPHGPVGPWEPLACAAGAAAALVALSRWHDRQVALLWVEFTPALGWRLARNDGRRAA